MQLGINPVGSPDATIEVFEDQGLIVRIVLNLSLDLVGLLPFPLITNQPQQPACQSHSMDRARQPAPDASVARP